MPALALLGVLLIGPMHILFTRSIWDTQTIRFQNSHYPHKKVEFQLQDIGALGYKKRTVVVTYWSDWFIQVKSFNQEVQLGEEWIALNMEVNELGLRY